jgi:hypothetical protein
MFWQFGLEHLAMWLVRHTCEDLGVPSHGTGVPSDGGQCLEWVQTRSFGDVGSMSGLLESGDKAERFMAADRRIRCWTTRPIPWPLSQHYEIRPIGLQIQILNCQKLGSANVGLGGRVRGGDASGSAGQDNLRSAFIGQVHSPTGSPYGDH